MIRLGINVDHVATIRQARGTRYPDPLEAARLALAGGADQITVHLREDRRHIQDKDVERLRAELACELNLEMAASDEIAAITCTVRPDTATLVPERREELTTEGGLDAAANLPRLSIVCRKLAEAGISVSLFIDPEVRQVEAAVTLGVPAVELHTGAYCDAPSDALAAAELERLIVTARSARKAGLKVCAGHGIHYGNAQLLATALPEVVEYNIGHAVVARAILIGMTKAVAEMKTLLTNTPPL